MITIAKEAETIMIEYLSQLNSIQKMSGYTSLLQQNGARKN